MRSLSTHVLDTAAGIPAAGMAVRLFSAGQMLFSGETNMDGRCSNLPSALQPGVYRLDFGVAEYFRAQGVTLPEPPFLDQVSITFGMAQGDGHYHVPLLVAPFAYSTYRGS